MTRLQASGPAGRVHCENRGCATNTLHTDPVCTTVHTCPTPGSVHWASPWGRSQHWYVKGANAFPQDRERHSPNTYSWHPWTVEDHTWNHFARGLDHNLHAHQSSADLLLTWFQIYIVRITSHIHQTTTYIWQSGNIIHKYLITLQMDVNIVVIH